MFAEMKRTSPDALLVVSFGGPEGMDDVRPFLANVTRGRGVPEERLEVVAKQYALFGGISPLNGQCRRLVASLGNLLDEQGPRLPVYLGHRNWHPFLEDTVRQMAQDGIGRAFAFVTSAYSSFSSCRQYLDDIDRARAAVGEAAPEITKLRPFWNHPGFIEPMAAGLGLALAGTAGQAELTGGVLALGEGAPFGAFAPQDQVGPGATRILFTAHSLPLAAAQSCDYQRQLHDAAELIIGCSRAAPSWEIVFQSRSGSPTIPWLEPDITERIETLAQEGVRRIIAVPLGFVFDHMEVLFDLDVRAAGRARDCGIAFERVATPGEDPRFVAMVRELMLERLEPGRSRRALGALGPRSDVCAADCCPAPASAGTR